MKPIVTIRHDTKVDGMNHNGIDNSMEPHVTIFQLFVGHETSADHLKSKSYSFTAVCAALNVTVKAFGTLIDKTKHHVIQPEIWHNVRKDTIKTTDGEWFSPSCGPVCHALCEQQMSKPDEPHGRKPNEVSPFDQHESIANYYTKQWSRIPWNGERSYGGHPPLKGAQVAVHARQ